MKKKNNKINKLNNNDQQLPEGDVKNADSVISGPKQERPREGPFQDTGK